jgi:hypothetical protein
MKKLLLTLLFIGSITSVFAAETSATLCTTAVSDSATGTVAWVNPTNACANDSTFATATLHPSTGGSQTDNSVKLVIAGTISGADRARGVARPAVETFIPYGSPIDLWDINLTPSDVNNSTFGVAFSAKSNVVGTGLTSEYLKATAFGFSIPTNTSILGVLAEVESSGSATNWRVDSIRMTIYYRLPQKFWIFGGKVKTQSRIIIR